VLVIGLGRFGTALAETLMDLGHEVLGVDSDAGNVQRNADLLTHVVQADATDEEVMRQLGAGSSAGPWSASAPTWRPASSRPRCWPGWKPPMQIVGRSLGDAQVRSRYGITVVCIKPAGGSFTYATPDTVPGPDDVLVVAGETDRVAGFAELG